MLGEGAGSAKLRRLREVNEELNLWERYHQKEVLKSRPVNLALATGERCNLRCVFCTDRDGEAAKDYEDLSFGSFLRFTPFLPFASEVALYGWGEPLVNQDYGKMFDYVSGNFPGIRISISTNGILLNGKWREKMLAHGKARVNVSLNAATPETYSLLMGSDRFHTVVENIREFCRAAKGSERGQGIDIALSTVAMRENIAELPRFVQLAVELGVDYVAVQDLLILNEDVPPESSIHYDRELAEAVFYQAAQRAREGNIGFLVEAPGFCSSEGFGPGSGWWARKREGAEIPVDWSFLAGNECFDPWTQFMISKAGDVSTCCHAHNTAMGNIFQQDFEQIWNGEAYRQFRRTVNTDRPPEDCMRCPIKGG